MLRIPLPEYDGFALHLISCKRGCLRSYRRTSHVSYVSHVSHALRRHISVLRQHALATSYSSLLTSYFKGAE